MADALADLGVEAADLQQAPLEPRGVALVTAEAPDGRSLLVKIYGRDALGRPAARLRLVLALVPGRDAAPRPGRREQVEHEAFVTLLAERAGVPVLPVVAAGMASERDALLVTETTGRPLRSLDPARDRRRAPGGHLAGDAGGSTTWASRTDGWMASRIVVRPDGSPAFGDFGEAEVAADDADIMADRAQLLVATALAAGLERAVSAALAALGPTRSRRCSRSCSPRRSSGRRDTRSTSRTGTSTT